MDGLGDRWSDWDEQNTETYNDKLWLPSAFEVLHTGYDNKSGSVDTIPDTGRYFDENEAVTYMSRSSPEASTGLDSSSWTEGKDGRTGLWELNGYDRATGSWAWLRSGYSDSYNYARAIDSDGNNDYYHVGDISDVRVALHLNLKSLANNVLASVSAGATTGDVVVMPQSGDIATTIIQNKGVYALKNDNTLNGQVQLVYDNIDTSAYNFTINIGGQEIVVGTSATSGSIPNYCNYSYTTSGNQVEFTLSNIQQSFNVSGVVEKPKCDISMTVTMAQTGDMGAVVYFMQGEDIIEQMYIASAQTISVQLMQGQEYKIVVSKPYLWQVDFDGDGQKTGSTFTFIVPNKENSTDEYRITIAGVNGGLNNSIVV